MDSQRTMKDRNLTATRSQLGSQLCPNFEEVPIRVLVRIPNQREGVHTCNNNGTVVIRWDYVSVPVRGR
jgi:hypothetical protein